jgi:hypothetical protein
MVFCKNNKRIIFTNKIHPSIHHETFSLRKTHTYIEVSAGTINAGQAVEKNKMITKGKS